ncbi:thioredoxin family protein [uncultured Mailhella sp.]|uniref:thioredoxin family protein n=1 Tax=uncultured Mailhella sp. TaxID=1981031 RepID=UPI0025E0DBE8|nr:thioredoxin family protein [uncultured Mailhella sp.]
MIIKVFGPGCSKCKETEHIVREAVEASGIPADVEKVSDLRAMMAAGILTTPAVAINDAPVCSGRVPSKNEVVSWIMTAAEKAQEK